MSAEKVMRALDQKSEVVLAGAAGTGKTTLIKEVIGLLDRAPIVLAPTGRAARRLRELSGFPASTIHGSGLYGGASENESGELSWSRPQRIAGPGQTIIVDEASMVGRSLAEDLRTGASGAKIIWVGDPHQLPPVQDTPGCNLQEPDVLLEKVWRNDSGIINFAHGILKASTPAQLSQLIQKCGGRYPGVTVCEDKAWSPQRWRAAIARQRPNQSVMLITYTNARRHALNEGVRAHLTYPGDSLVRGELLLIRSNQRNLGFVNGDMVTVFETIDEQDPDLPEDLTYVVVHDQLTDRKIPVYLAPQEFQSNSREHREARREASAAWVYHYRGRVHPKNPKWRAVLEASRNDVGRDSRSLTGPAAETLHANFGYCLTCHASQGSEADVVGISWDSWWLFRKSLEEARAWWYTAVTRARSSVVLWLE